MFTLLVSSNGVTAARREKSPVGEVLMAIPGSVTSSGTSLSEVPCFMTFCARKVVTASLEQVDQKLHDFFASRAENLCNSLR